MSKPLKHNDSGYLWGIENRACGPFSHNPWVREVGFYHSLSAAEEYVARIGVYRVVDCPYGDIRYLRVVPDLRLWKVEHRVVGDHHSSWIPEPGLHETESGALDRSRSLSFNCVLDGTVREYRVSRYQ